MGPPGAGDAPRIGRTWIRMTMMPMPDMNPDTNRHGDGHRRRGTGNLRARAAEHRGKEADRYCAVEAGHRPHAGGDAQGQGDR